VLREQEKKVYCVTAWLLLLPPGINVSSALQGLQNAVQNAVGTIAPHLGLSRVLMVVDGLELVYSGIIQMQGEKGTLNK